MDFERAPHSLAWEMTLVFDHAALSHMSIDGFKFS